MGADGSRLTRLTPPGTTTAVVLSYDSVSWSPDGTHIAVAAAHGPFWRTTTHSVYIASADGSSFSRIGPRGDIWDAVWSPDGRWIAFSMAAKATRGQFELYLMHPDGSGVRRLTSATGGLFSLHPTWSPDSSQLLFLRGTSDPEPHQHLVNQRRRLTAVPGHAQASQLRHRSGPRMAAIRRPATPACPGRARQFSSVAPRTGQSAWHPLCARHKSPPARNRRSERF